MKYEEHPNGTHDWGEDWMQETSWKATFVPGIAPAAQVLVPLPSPDLPSLCTLKSQVLRAY